MNTPPVFGPILGWEMTTLVRRSRYFLLRAGYVAILLFVLWSVYQSTYEIRWNNYRPTLAMASQFAEAFYGAFSFAQLAAVLLLTPAYIATAITVERERRTIEYLFATDLSNREIVLGKFLARALNVLMVVLAGLPIVSVASLFGGIDTDRLLMLTLVTASTVYSVGAVSTVVSVYAPKTRLAISNAYGLVLFFLIAPWFLWIGLEATKMWADRPIWLEDGLQAAAEAMTAVNPIAYVWMTVNFFGSNLLVGNATSTYVASHLAFGTLALGWAILRLRRAYRAAVSTGTLTKTKRSLTLRKVPPVGDRPVAWREWYFGDSRKRSKLAIVARIAALPIVAGPIVLIFFGPNVGRIDGDEINIMLRSYGTIVIGLVYLVAGIRAATSVGAERDKDTWISLLGTSLPAGEIVSGKVYGAMKPIFYVTILWLFFAILASLLGGIAIVAIPLMVAVILGYGFTVVALGVYQSLRQPTTNRAIFTTLAWMALFGGIGHMFGAFFVALLTFMMSTESFWMVYAASLPWFVIAATPFRWAEIESLMGREGGQVIAASAAMWLLFTSAGVLLLLQSISTFPRRTGRIEGRETPLPPPPRAGMT